MRPAARDMFPGPPHEHGPSSSFRSRGFLHVGEIEPNDLSGFMTILLSTQSPVRQSRRQAKLYNREVAQQNMPRPDSGELAAWTSVCKFRESGDLSTGFRRRLRLRGSEGGDSFADRVPGQFGDRVQTELTHDVAPMHLHSTHRDMEQLTD